MNLKADYLTVLFHSDGLVEYSNPDPDKLFYLDFWDVGFPLLYRVISSDQFKITSICVRTDVSPLMWVWFTMLNRLDKLKFCCMGYIYLLLKKTNKNKDFISRQEHIGGWARLLKFYLQRNKDTVTR